VLFRSALEVVGKKLSAGKGISAVGVNPLTASVLVEGDGLGIESLARLAESHDLFQLEKPSPYPALHNALKPLRSIDTQVRSSSGGRLNLATLVFVSVLGMGIYQIYRGNLGAPPWYTALWYAFGIFTKELAVKAVDA